MKIFLSWSGQTSLKLATIFRDWLPSVIQSATPYVSSEDIDKGARWSADIASELESSNYGIIFVTPANISAPWINFEAGALSKSIDKSNVSPFLFGLRPADIPRNSPIIQFQGTSFEKEEVLKLLKSINRANTVTQLDEMRLVRIFEVFWHELEAKLNEVPIEELASQDTPIHIEDSRDKLVTMVEEILELSRNQYKSDRTRSVYDITRGAEGGDLLLSIVLDLKATFEELNFLINNKYADTQTIPIDELITLRKSISKQTIRFLENLKNSNSKTYINYVKHFIEE